MFRRGIFAIVLLLLTPLRADAAQHHLTWTRTVEHLDWQTGTRVVRVVQRSYPIRKAHRPVVAYATTSVRRSPHVIVRTRFPVFQAAPRPPEPLRGPLIGYFPITAYSYGCGSAMPWQHPTMANGQPPFVGAISSDVLPRGETVLVVAAGPGGYSYRGTILDTGQGHGGLDLFTSTCGAAYGYTRRSAAVYLLNP